MVENRVGCSGERARRFSLFAFSLRIVANCQRCPELAPIERNRFNRLYQRQGADKSELQTETWAEVYQRSGFVAEPSAENNTSANKTQPQTINILLSSSPKLL